jgi:AraC-like DNA-binding protein
VSTNNMVRPAPREYAKFWLDPDLNNLEALRATYLTHVFPPHAHEGFAIGVIEAGGQAFTYQRRSQLIMPAHSIAVINPGVVHTGCAATEDGWTYRMIYPGAEILQRAASELSGTPRDIPLFPTPVIFDTDLMRRLLQLHAALEDVTTTRLERESRLLWTLAQLITRHADTPHPARVIRQEPTYVDRIREYLSAHFAHPVTLDQLAQLVHISPFHLLRVFHRRVGLPPHAYVIQLRVEHAKTLLIQGMPIAEVAAQVGFSDQSHLSRHFKRLVGVAPGQYHSRR